MSDSNRETGLSLLDAVALVTGAAVAAVHLRDPGSDLPGLTPLGWLLLIVAFAWLSITAAGPFVYLVRRLIRRPAGYPGPTDRLWLGLGLPWLVAGLVRSAAGGMFDPSTPAYRTSLFLGLAAGSALAIRRQVIDWPASLPPHSADSGGPTPPRRWTEGIGRAVAVAWPLQIGLGLVTTG